ncbi:MAG: hypothetical protein ABIC82_01675 [bacterium]
MYKLNAKKLFSRQFLSQFIFTRNSLPFFDEEIIAIDKELLNFERLFLNLDIEKNLISKIEFSSFAISKAENSTLKFTLPKQTLSFQKIFSVELNKPIKTE